MCGAAAEVPLKAKDPSGISSTEIAGRVPRGRLEIEDFHDDETLCVSNDLPRGGNAVGHC